MTAKTYNVGIYCRLSNDDERDGESVSIENQKLLLQNYVRQRGWNEIDTYIDDGYSGTNFDRPGVKRLIEDAKAKRINVILVKDLSRFGRNYIEFGQYTDYLFPSLGCRFIALNNGIDTESTNGSTDVMCFLNLFNEFYSRDTSKKVKAVKKACADCGFKMRNQVERFTYKDGTPGRYSSFICGNYSRSGKGACTIHTIYENVLTQLVLEDIREKARFAEYDPEQLVQQIIRLKDKEAKSRLSSCEQELKTYTARLSELERLMQNLYEDKCAGTIPQTVFQTLMHKSEAERAEKSEAIPELERKVKSYLENRTDANRWLAIIRRYTEITELDESILFELVDRIEVGETQKVGGQRICDLRVYYRYVGNVDAALVQQERRQPLEEAI